MHYTYKNKYKYCGVFRILPKSDRLFKIMMVKKSQEEVQHDGHLYCHGPLKERNRSLRWRHNGRDGVSNHQPSDCLLSRLFRRRSKKTSKPRVTGLCVGNSPGTGEFPAQMASNAENVSIWWRHHAAIDIWSISFRIASRLMPQGHTDDQLWLWLWFRLWLGAVRQQAITWTNVDLVLCRQMAPLGWVNSSSAKAGLYRENVR